MSRNSEIIKKADELYPETVGHDCWGHIETDVDPRNIGFIKGAVWADENPKSPWIKCSERLPEHGDYCLIAVNGNVVNAMAQYSEKARLFFHNEFNSKYNEYYTKQYGVKHVTAWMAIPKFEEE